MIHSISDYSHKEILPSDQSLGLPFMVCPVCGQFVRAPFQGQRINDSADLWQAEAIRCPMCQSEWVVQIITHDDRRVFAVSFAATQPLSEDEDNHKKLRSLFLMNTLKHGPSLAYWKFLGPNGLQDPILLCDDHAADRIAAGLKLAGYLAVDDPGERVCLDCAKAVDIRPGEQLPLPTLEAFFADEDDES